MTMTREEAIITLIENDVFREKDIEGEAAQFYIEGLMDGKDIFDIDRFAWLNTLFGYDIGRENARQIDSYLYGEMNEMETLDLTHRDKPVIQMVCERLELDLKFDKWATTEPKVYQYF